MLVLLAVALAGLVVLARAADQLVVGAARLAVAFRVSAVVIGVLVAFGTTSPELLVSGLAAGQGSIDLAIGNIVGSNTANLTLVLGIAVLICPVTITSRTLRKEASISTAAVLALSVLVQGGLRRLEAGLLLLGLVVALYAIFGRARAGDEGLMQEIEELTDGSAAHSVRVEITRTVLGLAGTLLGAQMLVHGARGIAREAGLAEGLVGLTLVAVGTSLPELVTSIHAARRREHDLIVGTLLGANMLNSLAVAAVAGLAGPGPVDPALSGVGAAIMVGVALVAWGFMTTGNLVARWEGAVLLGAYPLIVAVVGLT